MGTSRKSALFPGSVRRALFVLTGVAILPLVLIQGWIYYSWFQERADEQREANLVLARAVATTCQGFILDVHRQEIAIGAALTSLTPYSGEEANRFLTESTRQYTAIRAFDWVDPNGEIAASSDQGTVGYRIDKREYFRQVVDGRDWVVSDLLNGEDSQGSAFIIAQGVRDEKRHLHGLVLAAVDPRRLGELAIPINQPQGVIITLFDRKGALLYHRPEGADPDVNWLEADPLLKPALAGNEMIGNVRSPFDGQDRIAVRVPVSDVGWVAGASQSEQEMLAPLTASLALNAGMLLVVVAISFLLALGIAHMIMAALDRLRHHAQVLGEGQLGHRAEVGSFAELDALAGGFNEMAAQLQERRHAEQRANLELARANKEMEAFAYSVSHDLRGPLRSIDGFSQALVEDYPDKLDDQGRDYLQRVRKASQRMGWLIDDLLKLSRITRAEMTHETVDLSELARSITDDLKSRQPERDVEFVIQGGLRVHGDEALLRVALENLIGNAWKFTEKAGHAKIEFGASELDGVRTYYVRDNGAGFDMRYASKLFGPFQRLHTSTEFPGTGIGLATVQRIIHRHGGRVWAEGETGKGAAFYFTL